jgi:hypothetical protein
MKAATAETDAAPETLASNKRRRIAALVDVTAASPVPVTVRAIPALSAAKGVSENEKLPNMIY